MRVCVMYDCLYPWTVGGAERWYRALAERLAADGHEVTYVTLRQWDDGDEPALPGIRVIGLGGRQRPLYDSAGKRRVGPPLFFGLAALWWLLRNGRRLDVVHTASFPFFSLLALALTRPIGRYRVVCDWFEVWTLEYWQAYLGTAAGRIGWAVQWLCARVPQEAFVFSRIHGDRLHALYRGRSATHLTGAYTGSLVPPKPTPAPSVPHVVYAGRHIPEKQVPALIPALAWLRERLPALRVTLLGDGPERDRVVEAVREARLADVVLVPGFVSAEEVDATFAAASCVVQPSAREGYGLVVVESASRGVPAVVVAGPDNAATELIEPGQNGFVAPSVAPADLGGALLQALQGGDDLRRHTCEWFAANGDRLSLAHSLAQLETVYGRPPRTSPRSRRWRDERP